MITASTEAKDLLLIYSQLLCPFVSAPSLNSRLWLLWVHLFLRTTDVRQLGLSQALQLRNSWKAGSFLSRRQECLAPGQRTPEQRSGMYVIPFWMQVARGPGRSRGIQVSFPVYAEVLQWPGRGVNLTGPESARKQACGNTCEEWLS